MGWMRRAAAIAIVAAAALFTAGWLACTVYNPALLVGGDDSGGADVIDAAQQETAAPDSGDAGDAGPACSLAVPPSAPSKDDPSDAGDLDLLFAVRTVDLGIRDDGGVPAPYGYDLDGLCTCPGPADCVGTMPNCDQPGGIDNAGGALFRQFYQLSGGGFLSQDAANTQISAGQATLLLRVSKYNGKPNDTQVILALYVSDGTVPNDAGVSPPPVWDGTDTWTVDNGSLIAGITPKYFDSSAYVSGGTLVGRPVEYLVPLPLDQYDVMTVDLVGGIVTGKLEQAQSTWAIAAGIVDGRWPAVTLLGDLAYVHDPQNTNAYLCPSTSSYMGLKGLLCPSLDITADSTSPHSQPCDAISLAIGFAAQTALMASTPTTSTATTTCPDGGPDHC
jgi:hypothetical protein